MKLWHRTWSVFLGFCCFAPTSGFATELVIPRVAQAPAIDGRLDDPAWAQALRLTDFTLPGSAQRPPKPIEARLCFDAQALYIAFVCDEPNPERIRAQATLENAGVWQDDCVEVWIRTTTSTLEFDQFIANTLGTRESLRRRQGQTGPWRPTWQVRVARGQRQWTVEMRIPFSDLDIPSPQPGDMIQIKLGREDHTAEEAGLSVWPPRSPYAGTEGFSPVYFERANLLPNPDMAEIDRGKPTHWSVGKGDAALFSSAKDGERQVIRFEAPGRYSTAQQDLKLMPNSRYRLAASVKGTAGVQIRARTSPRAGAASMPYTAEGKASAGYQPIEVNFPTDEKGDALIIIGGTEATGKGEVLVADLRVVREPSAETAGPAIAVEPGPAEPTAVEKVAVADCRALKGFIGTPVDGTTQSRNWDGSVWEYNQPSAGAGVGYAYRRNDGLHITLADKGGFQAIQIRGGARVKVYRDCTKYDDPTSGTLLAELPGGTNRSRVWLEKPVPTDRVSFFDLTDGRLADVSFFRVRRGLSGLGTPQRWQVDGPIDADALRHWRPIPLHAPDPTLPEIPEIKGGHDWLGERFLEADRRLLGLKPGGTESVAINAEKGQTLHLVSPPLGAELPLGALGLDFVARDAPLAFAASVQDPLNPRSELVGADFSLSKPGRCRVVLDFPDQIVPKGAVLWVSLKFDAPVKLADMAVELFPAEREKALPQALAYRKLLLKTYYCSLSEARPWNGWYRDEDVEKGLSTRWGPQLREMLMTLDQCRALGPKDDLLRQYDEWIWRGYRRKHKTWTAFEPKIDQVAGAPEWAVVARQAWLTAREVPRWWVENRMVPTGEFGGEVGDDTDMYGNYEDFPMFESDGVGAMVKEGAARLAELAEQDTMEAGLNRRTMDPLHAYEEGVNHESLIAWWNYGDPVYFERCMVAAKSTEALTVVTPKGHRHFKSQDCGAADLRMDRKLGTDGQAHPLMWRPTFEVAWYNRNPRALRNLTEWADGWLAHMEPGKYAAAVDVAAERVVETTDRPLYVGYGALGSAFLYLSSLTGETKYLEPFFEEFRKGERRTAPGLILPELIHRGVLPPLGDKLAEAAKGEGVSEWLVTGDKKPLIDALKADIAELQRFPAFYTTVEPFTDRVFLYAISNAAIAYTGGYATRNKFNHTHAVSWEGFSPSTDFAALVLKAKRDLLKVLVYNFADKPLAGRMRTWTLDHGEYQLRVGSDTTGKDTMDRAERDEKLEVLRATAIPLTLPPKAVTVVELRQTRRLDDEWLRADLALSPREIRVEGGVVRGTVHNIGSKPVGSFEVALVDDRGAVRSRKALGPLDAPLDLVPRRLAFELDGLPQGAKGWAVVVDPESKVPEIFRGNNRVELPAR